MIQLSKKQSHHPRDQHNRTGSGDPTVPQSTTQRLIKKLKLVFQVANERRCLSQLSDHQLRDIGLTRDEVDREVKRGLFETPQPGISHYGRRSYGSNGSTNSRIKRLPED